MTRLRRETGCVLGRIHVSSYHRFGAEEEKMLNDFSWKRSLPGIVETLAKSLSFYVRYYRSLGVGCFRLSCAVATSHSDPSTWGVDKFIKHTHAFVLLAYN